MSIKRTTIIAEMACSHEGDPKLAREIIKGAGEAGADAIQFQIWTNRAMVPQHPDYNLIRRIELTKQDWQGLTDYTREYFSGMEIVAQTNHPESLAFCEELGVDAYKIHASDLSNPPLLNAAAATGKRIDLSVGGSSFDEISTAIQSISERKTAGIWLMYGLQNFPTPPEDVTLGMLAKLKGLYELPVGYQDHSDAESPAAFWLPAAAQGLDVDILEKHITHDRSQKGIDHQAALNPDEFGRFVAMVREIDAALGDPRPRPFTAAEQQYRRYAKKSLVALRDLKAGTVLAEGDLEAMRVAAPGIAADDLDELLGRKLSGNLAQYEPIMPECLE
jgi:sialic acid synthase SpsE